VPESKVYHQSRQGCNGQ